MFIINNFSLKIIFFLTLIKVKLDTYNVYLIIPYIYSLYCKFNAFFFNSLIWEDVSYSKFCGYKLRLFLTATREIISNIIFAAAIAVSSPVS